MKKKHWLIIGIAVVVFVAVVAVLFFLNGEKAAYETICDDGYQGSAEEFLASLVGEQKAPGIEASAYSLACEKGYSKSFDQWMQTVAGATTADMTAPAYTVACENGYSGTLAQWLDSLVPEPKALGKSENSESKTEYELACEYGFEGTFSEWLVSLANDVING